MIIVGFEDDNALGATDAYDKDGAFKNTAQRAGSALSNGFNGFFDIIKLVLGVVAAVVIVYIIIRFVLLVLSSIRESRGKRKK